MFLHLKENVCTTTVDSSFRVDHMGSCCCCYHACFVRLLVSTRTLAIVAALSPTLGNGLLHVFDIIVLMRPLKDFPDQEITSVEGDVLEVFVKAWGAKSITVWEQYFSMRTEIAFHHSEEQTGTTLGMV